MHLLTVNESLSIADAPVSAWNITQPTTLQFRQAGTVFGCAIGKPILIDTRVVKPGDFFCISLPEKNSGVSFRINESAMLIQHEDYVGHPYIVGSYSINGPGFQNYIDGCTASLLVCPPRKGEPCLNALYFPPGIDQSWHDHPSARIGKVVSGKGFANYGEVEEVPLKSGDMFYLTTGERHRFRTTDSPMVIVAYHPDSDFGPEDENHPMFLGTKNVSPSK